MKVWEDPKNPGEVAKIYSFDWVKDVGNDPIASATAEFIAGSSAGMSIVPVSGQTAVPRAGVFSDVRISGGTAGEIGLVLGTVTTDGGQTFTEVAQLKVVDPASATVQTAADLIADRQAVYSARLSFITGTQIKEVWRDGRRITYNTLTSLKDFDDALAAIDKLIADVAAADAGVPRRRYRALRPRFA